MRVVAGAWRGRKLVAPPGDATRPTADRTRETLFSMLVSRLGAFDDLRVADLFAGSGALGLEALSRGAASVTFVEQARAAIQAIEANLAALGATPRATIRAASALKLPRGERFDLVFADPPYADGAGQSVIAAVASSGWLAPGGWLAIETARDEALDPAPFELDAARDVGRARLTLLRAPA
ncbi:MAG: 16S rRNA (guanine(966)-N(2))-methyltransferase RsmD [Sphingomicrobium sp.]